MAENYAVPIAQVLAEVFACPREKSSDDGKLFGISRGVSEVHKLCCIEAPSFLYDILEKKLLQ